MSAVREGTHGGRAQFGARLSELRKAAGLSLSGLAAKVNYSTSYLSKLENGHRTPTAALAAECDAALGAGGELEALANRLFGRARRSAKAESGGKSKTPAIAKSVTTKAVSTKTAAAKSVHALQDRSARADGSLGEAPKLLGPVPRKMADPATVRPSGHGAEFDRLISRGDIHQAAGEMLQAGRWYLEAYRMSAGAPRAQAEAVIRLARRWSDPGQLDREAIALIERSLAALAQDSTATAALLRLRLNAHLAKKLSMAVSRDAAGAELTDGSARGAALAVSTLGSLPPHCPDEVCCEVLTECRWALYEHRPASDLLSLSERLQIVALRTTSGHFHGEALVALAVDQLRVGRIPAALATVANHRGHAIRSRSALARWHLCVFDALLNLWRGHFAEAEEWILGESLETVTRLKSTMELPVDTLQQTRLGQTYWLLHEQGRMAELFAGGLARDVEDHGYAPIWQAGLALALCDVDSYAAAADQMAGFAEDTRGFDDLPANGTSVATLTLLAEACAALDAHGGFADEVAALAPLLDRLLEPHQEEIALAGWPAVLVGPVARAGGLLALAMGRRETALERFRVAARFVRRSSPPHMARLRVDRARALLYRGGSGPEAAAKAEADGLLSLALATAEELGMRRLVQQIGALRET